MTQTGVNLIAMLSVNHEHRPNAMAFLMLTSHLLGDVPLPIILGLIKDKLAPACRVDSSGGFTDPEQCKEQEAGLRQSLAIAYAWTLWALLFFAIATRFARREVGKARAQEANTLLFQEDSGEGTTTFQYYHAQFQPPKPQSETKDGLTSPLDGSAPLN